jgi:hypothetical protein
MAVAGGRKGPLPAFGRRINCRRSGIVKPEPQVRFNRRIKAGVMAVEGKKPVTEKQIGKTTIRVRRPQTEAAEREKRLQALCRAMARCYRSGKPR